jgi:rubrerythrin
MSRDLAVRALRRAHALEESAAKFYEKASKLVEDPSLAAALSFVAAESSNHARLIQSLFGTSEGCEGALGTAGERIIAELEKAAAELEGGWKPAPKELAALLRKLNDAEKLAGEEAYSQMIAKALSLELSDVERLLLEAVAEEEKFHYRIVEKVAGELEKRGSPGADRRAG